MSEDVNLRIRARNDTDAAFNKAKRNARGLRSELGILGRFATAAFAADVGRRIIQTADRYNRLSTRIKTATRDTGDFAQVQSELANIAVETGTSFETAITTFQQLSRVRRDLDATNADFLKLTRTVEQLGVIGGASNEAIRFGLRQFNQGLAAGVLRAEEFNSIVENLPELAARLAKGFDVTQGQLRQMVIDGEVLSKDLFENLLKQSDEIAEQFKEIPPDMARGFETLSTATGRTLSAIDKAAGFTSTLGRVLGGLGYALNIFVQNATQLDPAAARLVTMQNRLQDLQRIAKDPTFFEGVNEFLRGRSETDLQEEINRLKAQISAQKSQIAQANQREEEVKKISIEEQIAQAQAILFAARAAEKAEKALAQLSEEQRLAAEFAKQDIELAKERAKEFEKQEEGMLEYFNALDKEQRKAFQTQEEGMMEFFNDLTFEELDKANKKIEDMKKISDQFARTFTDNLVESASNGFDDLLGMFKRTVAQMVATWASTQIFKFGQNLFSGLFTGVSNALPGFATGGSFVVGGASGVDANTVAFRATRGERVTITPPGQGIGGGGVVINNHVDARGANPNEIDRVMRESEQRTIAEVRDLMARNRL